MVRVLFRQPGPAALFHRSASVDRCPFAACHFQALPRRGPRDGGPHRAYQFPAACRLRALHKAQEPATGWLLTAGTAPNFPEFRKLVAGRSDFGDLGVAIPPDFQAYLDLGRFRRAVGHHRIAAATERFAFRLHPRLSYAVARAPRGTSRGGPPGGAAIVAAWPAEAIA